MHDLSAAGLPADAPVVLAAHGITANGYWWLPLARELQRRGSRVRLLAPCLRGRGDSRSVGEPYGLAAHARDLVEVAARLGARPLLLGHSMGAFVAGLALADRPGAFAGALLVDGGVAVPRPGDDPHATARRVLRPLLARLDLRFADAGAYVEDWARHPALRPLMAGEDAGILRQVALHDAIPTDDGAALRSGVVKEAVTEDGRDVAAQATASSALGAALEQGMPVELVWARRGLFDEPKGVYDEARLAALAPAGLKTTCVEDANHLSVVLAQPGLGVLAGALDRLLAQVGPPSGQKMRL